MLRYIVIAAIALVLLSVTSASASATDWWKMIEGLEIGVQPGYGDGYDGEPRISDTWLQGYHGILVALYRQTGPGWPGQTGFYARDFESPIPQGGSKTWSDIYLWARTPQVPIGNPARILCTTERQAPADYTATLVLDYVPSSLNYTGPMTFSLNLRSYQEIWLPTPTLDSVPDPSADGDKLTRMHVTVTAPVPEPLGMTVLGSGLAAVGLPWLRRRVNR